MSIKTHLKKCDICGMEYEESDDLSYLLIHGPAECPYCSKIIKLRKILEKYSNEYHSNLIDNEIYERNFYPDNHESEEPFGQEVSSSTLDEHLLEYVAENRTQSIEEIINRIQFVRKYLITRVGAQFEILDSIYEKKNIFWRETGNFLNFVHDASFQYIIIKLKEILGSSSKYSITKIRNCIENNQTAIFKKQKVYEVYTFKKSGDVLKQLFPVFPILEYLNNIDDVLNEYKNMIQAINILRDKEFAHLDGTNVDEYYKEINYVGLKRIYNSLRIIYDGFLCSVAPEKLNIIMLDYNMWFSHLDDITEYWIENKRKSAL